MASQAVANLNQAEARKWIDSLPADARWAAEAAAISWISGQAAAERFTQLLAGADATAQGLPKIARIAGHNFARDNPDQAAEWAKALPAGQVQLEAAAGVVSAWAKLDPAATSEWAASLPQGEARDGAAVGLAEAMAASDPDAALNGPSLSPVRRSATRRCARPLAHGKRSIPSQPVEPSRLQRSLQGKKPL